MNQALDKFLHEVEMPDGGIAEEAFLRGWRAALEASHHAELVEALRNLAAVSTNPYDNGPYEDGEVPEIDAAREVLAKVGGES